MKSIGHSPFGAGRLVELGEVIDARPERGSPILFRRDAGAADMVTAELAGTFEAPVCGIIAINRAIAAHDWAAQGLVRPVTRLHGRPEDERRPTILCDGEWEITWVTFRDMGAAFGAALLGIYVLVVAQFRRSR